MVEKQELCSKKRDRDYLTFPGLLVVGIGIALMVVDGSILCNPHIPLSHWGLALGVRPAALKNQRQGTSLGFLSIRARYTHRD